MHRRTFIIAGSAATLGGCVTGPDQTIATVASDAKLIASGLQGVLSQLGTLQIPGLTPSIIATAGVAIAGIQAVADALAGSKSTAEAQPLVRKIETYVNTVVGVLATLPLPPQIALPLQAATILLPVIEAMIGLVIPAAPARPTMTPDQARLVLVGAAI